MKKKKSLVILLVCAAVGIGAVWIVRAAARNPDRILSRAEAYYHEGNLDKARLEFLSALRVDPGNPRAIRQLGLIWAKMGSPMQAGRFLTKADQTEPGDPEITHELVKVLIAARQFPTAREKSLALLEKNPADGEALILLINSSGTEEEVAEAAERLGAFSAAGSADFHLASAALASRKGDRAAASASLEKAVELAPKSSRALLALAFDCETSGKADRALPLYARAAELPEDGLNTRLQYAKALARAGKTAEGKAVATALSTSDRYYLPAWTFLSELSLREGDTKGAMGQVMEALQRDETFMEAHVLRAGILDADGKKEEATTALEEVNRMYPGQVNLRMLLAKSYFLSGQPSRAGVVLDEVLKLAPDYAEATVLQAQLNLRNGEASAASRALENLLEKNALLPQGPQVEMLLAGAYAAEGRLDDAAGVFRRLSVKLPDSAVPQFRLGMVLKTQGKADEALAAFEKAQALAPKDQTIIFQLIELDVARKDFVSAHRRAREQESLAPGTWSPLFLEGMVYTAEEKWDDAEKTLLKAIELQPDSLSLYNLLLTGYMKQGRVPEMITRLEEFLEKKPKSTPQRLTLALLCAQQGLVDKQVAAYEQVLADEPDFVTALNNLSYLCLGPLNDLDRALALATKARSLQPDSFDIADTLGWIHFKRKEYPEALTLLEEAAGKAPENLEIQYHLGMARYMRGQKETARTALEAAVSSKTPYEGLEEAKKYLAMAKGGSGSEEKESIESLLARLEKTPGDLVARTHLAQLQAAGGMFTEAAANYELAVKANPSLVDAWVALTDLYVGPLNDLERGLDRARRGRALDGRNPETARALGEAILRTGDYRYAYNLLREASPGTAAGPSGVSFKLATAAYGIGRIDEARTLLQGLSAATDSPDAKAAQRFLALVGKPDANTAATAAEALKEDPDNLPALMAQAGLVQGDGATEKALGLLEPVLKKRPEFVPAQKEVSALLLKSGQRLDEARRWADKARQALPEDPEIARTLGILRFRTGDAEPAIRLLKESAAKAALDGEALFTLGMAQLKEKANDEGIASLKAALQTSDLPDSLRPEAEKAMAESAGAEQ